MPETTYRFEERGIVHEINDPAVAEKWSEMGFRVTAKTE